MNITVELLVGLNKHSPTGESHFRLQVTRGATVGEVLEQLGVPSQKLKVVLVNGRQALPQSELKEHDLLVVFPPLEGG